MKLLDELQRKLKLKNDRQLSEFLDISPPTICKIRTGKRLPSGEIIIRIHELTGMSIKSIKELI